MNQSVSMLKNTWLKLACSKRVRDQLPHSPCITSTGTSANHPSHAAKCDLEELLEHQLGKIDPGAGEDDAFYPSRQTGGN
jgi:hypothetical protein